MTNLTPDRLSRVFADCLRMQLTPAEWTEMLARNARYAITHPLSCASHDFLDANEVMLDAFAVAADRLPDLGSDDDLGLINAAWSLAKKNILTAGA